MYVTMLSAPVAGGCNLEFSLEDDANVHVEPGYNYHTVGFAWAALPYARTQPPSDCEKVIHPGVCYRPIMGHGDCVIYRIMMSMNLCCRVRKVCSISCM